MTVFIATTSQIATRLVGRVGVKPLFAGGLVLVSIGMALLSGISAHGSYLADALPGLAFVSLGMGCAFTTSTVAATAAISDGEQGLVSGLLVTSQQVGASIGLAVLASIAAAQTRHAAGPLTVALVDGFQAAFRVAIGFALIGAIAVVVFVQDSACVAELRRRALRALVHRPVIQPVNGPASPCWPGIADLQEGQVTLPAEAAVVADA